MKFKSDYKFLSSNRNIPFFFDGLAESSSVLLWLPAPFQLSSSRFQVCISTTFRAASPEYSALLSVSLGNVLTDADLPTKQ